MLVSEHLSLDDLGEGVGQLLPSLVSIVSTVAQGALALKQAKDAAAAAKEQAKAQQAAAQAQLEAQRLAAEQAEKNRALEQQRILVSQESQKSLLLYGGLGLAALLALGFFFLRKK